MDIFEAILWLTLNIYNEARSDDQLAQIAVGHVTLNRAKVRKLSIKQVVLQPYQFSWTHQLSSWIPNDPRALMECMESATIAITGHDFTDGSTYYHLEDIEPYWASSYKYVATYGSHKFYK